MKKDYILRLIDRLMTAVTRALGLRDAGQYLEALQLLRAEAGRIIGIEGMILEMMSLEELRKAAFSLERQIIAGRFLEEMAVIHDSLDDPGRAASNRSKALDLYCGALADEPDILEGDLWERSNSLAELLASEPLTWDERRLLFAAFGALERYDDAEDTLFALLDDAPEPERIAADGIEFYERLCRLSDDELETGGLPRSEVEESLAELREHSSGPVGPEDGGSVS